MKVLYTLPLFILFTLFVLACKFSLLASPSVTPFQPEVTVFIPQGADAAKGTWPKGKPLLLCVETPKGRRWWKCDGSPVPGTGCYYEIAEPTDTRGYYPLSSYFMAR